MGSLHETGPPQLDTNKEVQTGDEGHGSNEEDHRGDLEGVLKPGTLVHQGAVEGLLGGG